MRAGVLVDVVTFQECVSGVWEYRFNPYFYIHIFTGKGFTITYVRSWRFRFRFRSVFDGAWKVLFSSNKEGQ